MEDGMWSGTVHIGAVLGCDSNRTTKLNDLHEHFDAIYSFLLKSNNIDILFGIFSSKEQIPVI